VENLFARSRVLKLEPSSKAPLLKPFADFNAPIERVTRTQADKEPQVASDHAAIFGGHQHLGTVQAAERKDRNRGHAPR